MIKALRILAMGLALCVAIVAARWAMHSVGGNRDSTRFQRSGNEAFPPESGETIASTPLQIGDPVPDAVLRDQHGQELLLSDLRGTALVLTFLYTSCNLPSMCPLTTSRLAEVHDLIKNEDPIGEVRFLVVSFDPERDRPEQLRAYAQRHGLEDPSFFFATGEPEEVGRLSRAFNTYYRPSESGIFDHNIVVAVIDRQGFLRSEFFGTSWTAEELLTVLVGLDT